tara:strand:- start:482 stop:622 length:141 start_codon:yes stop_codon:yes gene_type:complete
VLVVLDDIILDPGKVVEAVVVPVPLGKMPLKLQHQLQDTVVLVFVH